MEKIGRKVGGGESVYDIETSEEIGMWDEKSGRIVVD